MTTERKLVPQRDETVCRPEPFHIDGGRAFQKPNTLCSARDIKKPAGLSFHCEIRIRKKKNRTV